MPKQIIPPDPIPIKDIDFDIPVGCTIFHNGGNYPSDEITQKIISYLDSTYENTTYIGNRTYLISVNSEDCLKYLLSEIPNITEEEITSRLIIIPNTDDTTLVSIC